MSVSIQLVFPASGKELVPYFKEAIAQVSIQLVFPASGKDDMIQASDLDPGKVSIQLVFPASGKERSLKIPPAKNSSRDFRKPIFKLHFSHRYCKSLATLPEWEIL